jgi:probable rRNA maturation factor
VRVSSHYIGPWRIDVDRRDGVPRLKSAAALARSIARTLDTAGAPRPASLGLVLADDAELAQLNAEHMGKDGPTDVLSFPLLPPETFPAHLGKASPGKASPLDAGARTVNTGARTVGTGPIHGSTFALPPGIRLHLGDIVVSVERAIDQAGAGRGGQTGNVRWDAGDELRLLVTHGTLHVCGWDHAELEEEAAMRSLERGILETDRG